MICYKHNITYYLNDCPECLKEKYQKKTKTDEAESEVRVEAKVKVNFADILEEKKNELRILLAKLPKNDNDDETIRKKQMLTYGLLIIRDIESKISA